jgi:hypothetical protein
MRSQLRLRSDLEMVRTLVELQQFTATKEFALLGIVRAAQEESFCELRVSIAIDGVMYQRMAARIRKAGSQLAEEWNATKVVTVAPSPKSRTHER